MKKEEAISYLKQLYPNGGHCWLDEQRMEAIGMAVKALQEEPVSEEQVKEDTMAISKEWFEHCKKSWYNEGYIDGEYNRDRQFENSVSEDFENITQTITYEGEVYTRCYKDKLDAFACKYPMSVPKTSKKYAKYSDVDLTIAVKKGAQWQKDQMMAKAADMVVGYWMPNGLMLTVDETENCYNIDEGDRVKVILIKEE